MAATRVIEIRTEIPGPRSREILERERHAVARPLIVHEPLVALDGGGDGLDVMRRVVAEAADWLAPGGSLLVETSERQAPAAEETVRGGGLAARVVVSEELYATVVIGTRPR